MGRGVRTRWRLPLFAGPRLPLLAGPCPPSSPACPLGHSATQQQRCCHQASTRMATHTRRRASQSTRRYGARLPQGRRWHGKRGTRPAWAAARVGARGRGHGRPVPGGTGRGGGLAGRHAGELPLQPPWPRGGARERRCWGREDLGCSFAFSAGEGRDLGFDPSVMRNPYLQMRLAFRSGLLETVSGSTSSTIKRIFHA